MINNHMISEIGIEHYLIVSSLIFSIGVFGLFMHRKNLITIMMSIEIMLLAVNINFVAFSAYLQEISGQIFSVFILTIAAAEVSIGLAIIIVHFRNRSSIATKDLCQMKG